MCCTWNALVRAAPLGRWGERQPAAGEPSLGPRPSFTRTIFRPDQSMLACMDMGVLCRGLIRKSTYGDRHHDEQKEVDQRLRYRLCFVSNNRFRPRGGQTAVL